MSFLQKDKTTSGVVLEDFDRAFKNRFYHSYLDNAENINTTAVASTASLIARPVYLLGNNAANVTSPESIVANASLVDELVWCLLSRTPGMTCDLVTGLIPPIEQYANHYVGVILGNPSERPYVGNIDDTSRFTWNFLASRTGILRGQNGNRKASTSISSIEDCTETCSREDELCAAQLDNKKDIVSNQQEDMFLHIHPDCAMTHTGGSSLLLQETS